MFLAVFTYEKTPTYVLYMTKKRIHTLLNEDPLWKGSQHIDRKEIPGRKINLELNTDMEYRADYRAAS